MKKNYFEEYGAEIEAQMLAFHASLAEKFRRRYAGMEAQKLGFGGKAYISRILQIDVRTVTHGVMELQGRLSKKAATNKERCAGGGRKKKRTLSDPDAKSTLSNREA
jgi:hypothetical protein